MASGAWRLQPPDRGPQPNSHVFTLRSGRRPAQTCLPCRPPSTERCLVFCSPVLAASAFVSRGRLFEMAAAGAGEETDSAMVVMSLVGVTASRERPGGGCKLKADQRPGVRIAAAAAADDVSSQGGLLYSGLSGLTGRLARETPRGYALASLC